MSRALFSLGNPSSGIKLAKTLNKLNWEIIATKETVKEFKENDILATPIEEFLNFEESFPFPPTLHPAVEMALTASKEHNHPKQIDLIFDITYPFEEGIDVGGHTLLALGAKGERIVLSDEEDATRFSHLIETNSFTAVDHSQFLKKATAKLKDFYSSWEKRLTPHHSELLAEGENPFQSPATISGSLDQNGLGLPSFHRHSEAKLCYTNAADTDNLINCLVYLAKNFHHNFGRVPHLALAAKHGNPIGLSASFESKAETIEKSLWANPQAIWGGELVVNFDLDDALASAIISSDKREELLQSSQWMLDVVAAPRIEPTALENLLKRKNRKVLTNPNLAQAEHAPLFSQTKSIRGGHLHQPSNEYLVDLKKTDFSDEEKINLLITWACVAFSFHGGNEVAIAANAALISCGGGPSTVEAAETATQRMKNLNKQDMKNCYFAADAFFPFTDAPEILVNSGVRGGIFPSGGMRFDDVSKYFHEKQVKCLYLPENIRGFCRH